MVTERESMTLNEVVAKPKRRQFTAEYRLRILEEADRCMQPGEVGRLLRRELVTRGELYRALWIQGAGIVAILTAIRFVPI